MSSGVASGQEALIRLERLPGIERNQLLDAGLPVVEELSSCFLALGEEEEILRRAAAAGVPAKVLAPDLEGFDYGLLGLRAGVPAEAAGACGQVLWSEGNVLLIRALDLEDAACSTSEWYLRPLSRQLLGRSTPPPAAYDGRVPLEIKPLVQEMVDAITDQLVLEHWNRIVTAASTRYSTAAGCATAAQTVFDLFDDWGLSPQFQSHTTGHAPNIIGALPGSTTPANVDIVIGHLDDLPSSGLAPGADDNASGSAMVTALAEVLSCYQFANTLKFIAVTGEEFGLYGSEYYADHNPPGDTIQAVLNGDMISWEGDGLPASENLDVNTNPASAWLGTLMVQAASDYGTGCPVNAFSCPDMAYSDHWPFWQHGWSAICGITDNEGFCGQPGDYPYIHSSNDTIANNGDPAFYASAVRAYAATLAHLADPIAALAPTPTGLAAGPDGDNRIALSWSSSGSGLTFEILRAPGGCAGALDWTPVGETAGLAFTDTTASGGLTYAYAVRGRETAGRCVSGLSECVEASTTGPCLEAPAFGGATAVSDGHLTTCTLTVSWSPAQTYCGGPVSYNVYRSTSPGFLPAENNRIASGVTGTSFPDSDALGAETLYYYVVRAVDGGNGVEEGNTVKRSGSPTGPYSPGSWSDDAGDSASATLEPELPWAITATGGHSGPQVYATGDYGNDTCAGLVSPTLHLGAASTLSFWSKYGIEAGWDKGEVQLSTNGGAAWTRVALAYPGSGNQTGDACGLPSGLNYFTGSNAAYTEYTAALAAWADQDVQLRWLISSDVTITGSGWWVDDLELTDVLVPGTCTPGSGLVSIFTDSFESGTTAAWSVVVP